MEYITKIMLKNNNIQGSISQMTARMASLEGELSVYKNSPPTVTITTFIPNEQNYRC